MYAPLVNFWLSLRQRQQQGLGVPGDTAVATDRLVTASRKTSGSIGAIHWLPRLHRCPLLPCTVGLIMILSRKLLALADFRNVQVRSLVVRSFHEDLFLLGSAFQAKDNSLLLSQAGHLRKRYRPCCSKFAVLYLVHVFIRRDKRCHGKDS